MKKILIFLWLNSLCMAMFAQAPQGIPYQAIARNSSGNILVNQNIRVRFTIKDSVATGTIKYQETFNPTTNTLGLFNVNVGMGTVVSGAFSAINWGVNAKFMQVEMDPAGGTAYVDMGTTQMLSVPYALYAGSSAVNQPSQQHMQVFTVSGTFHAPTTITNSTTFKITVVGGGGSGGSGSNIYFGGSGGGAGGTAIYVGSGLNPGSSYTVTVGLGGTATSSLGNSGGSSSFNLGTFAIVGEGGYGGYSGTSGGSGGSASQGTFNTNGGEGNPGHAYIGVTSSGFGGNGGASFYGGMGAFGTGGKGGNSNGSSGYSWGSNGKSGVVILEWNQ